MQNFCGSPWFHVKIGVDGRFHECRWSRSQPTDYNIKTHSITDFMNSPHMRELRVGMTQDKKFDGCSACHKMEAFSKISGREKQNLKLGIYGDVSKTIPSSRFYNDFKHSQDNDGFTSREPMDLQLDLGNICNSACIFCSPESSSTLGKEWEKLNFIEKSKVTGWTDDATVQKFCDEISTLNIKYIHFIGGETLLIPGFLKILQSLDKNATVGFTVNATVWKDEVIEELEKFDNVHLGISVECFHKVNDFLRYPSKISNVERNIQRWMQVNDEWTISLRTTPTVFSIPYLYTVYTFALENDVFVESCNFLEQPEFLRPTILAKPQREESIQRLQEVADSIETINQSPNSNIRDKNNVKAILKHDIESYVKYLSEADSESFRVPEMKRFVETIGRSRNMDIRDYFEHYDKYFGL